MESQLPSPPVTKDTPRSSLKTSRMLVAVAPTPAEMESPTAPMTETSWGDDDDDSDDDYIDEYDGDDDHDYDNDDDGDDDDGDDDGDILG